MDKLTVFNQNGKLLVNSREVAEMVHKDHKHLMRDIRGYCEILTRSNFGLSDFFLESTYQDSTGRTLPCYLLTRKGCDMVANKMTGEKGVLFTAAYVTKFEQMENQIKAFAALPDFNNPIIAARAWADQVELRQVAELKLVEAQPKILFAESVQASDTTILIREMAKILNQNGVDIGQNRFFEWLREHGYLIKQHGADRNMPTQRSMKLGLFEVKETTVNHSSGAISVSRTPKITGKGQVYFVNKFLKVKRADNEVIKAN
jgi:Rha family phage regulatory protein